METLVIGALNEEINGLRAALENAESRKLGPFEVHCGKFGGKSLFLCRCGVGKTNAAAATSAVLTAFPSVKRVINTGVAGGIGGGIKRCDVALGIKTVHHDYDQTPDGYRKGQVDGFDSEFFDADKKMLELMERALKNENIRYVKGVIASGDQFIASKETAKRINGEFGAIACDFESAPIAQVCALYKIPFLSLRAISDDGGDGAVTSFYEFLHSAAEKNASAIKAFMQM